MRYLVDAQLPPGLARWLTDRGYPSQHVADVGLAGATDSEIWRYAKARQAVILTKDEDFTTFRYDADSPSVVWVRMGNTTNTELKRVFDVALPAVERALGAGEKLIELR